MNMQISVVLAFCISVVSSQGFIYGPHPSLICEDGSSASCQCDIPPCKLGGNSPTCSCEDGSTPRPKPPCHDGSYPDCPGACPDGSDASLSGTFLEPPCADRSRPDFTKCICADGSRLRRGPKN